MSGFFGVVRTDGAPVEERFLREIAEDMRFRGPDGLHTWSEKNIGGCFAFMRTGPAAQADRQPVRGGERYLLWGDMRLDAREELREELGEEEFRIGADASSEEYFLRAWQQWGDGALNKVIGDFSLALWDSHEQTLWCARDFIGPRPFYYVHVGEIFSFANSLELLRRLPGVSSELDETYLGDFLLETGNADPWRTAYRDIRRLPAGNLLRLKDGNAEVRRFRTLPVEEPLRLKRPEDYAEQYRLLLRAAVKDRLPKKNVTIYLSGGLDSGAVSAMATQLAGESGCRNMLKASTVSWKPLLEDCEPEAAELTAQHLGIAHEILQEEQIVPFEQLDEADGRTPEPTLEPFVVRQRKQWRKLAAHSNVVLNGHGGDDIAIGQSWPYLVYLWKRREWRTLADDFGGYVLRYGRFPPLRGGFRTKIRRILKWEEPSEVYPDWFNEEFEARTKLRERWKRYRSSSSNRGHPLHPNAYEAYHDGFWGEILETEDAAWTGVALEMRMPLLDLRVILYLLKLPPVPWCVNKEIVRVATRNLLPAEIVQRPKTPMVEGELKDMDPHAIKMRHIDTAEGACRTLKRFVNFEKWCETFNAPKGSLTWLDLRPLSLLKWLKAVENAKGIK